MIRRLLAAFRKPTLETARSQLSAVAQTVPGPWAIFEITGLEKDGRVKVEFNWNPSFIKMINALGFQAETDEDSVQLFFYTSQMRPISLGGDETVQSADLPSLSQPANRIVK